MNICNINKNMWFNGIDLLMKMLISLPAYLEQIRCTDKELLPVRVLKKLVEHFSTKSLTLKAQLQNLFKISWKCPQEEPNKRKNLNRVRTGSGFLTVCRNPGT